MKSNLNFYKWLLAGMIAEVLIFGYSYFYYEEAGEVFRHAARYSGRLSLFVYLFAFYFFATTINQQNPITKNNLKKWVTLFSVLHFIHFGFLATNIYLNHIQLIPYKLAGGFLAYLLILIYPFIIDKLRPKHFLHYAYFYYVGIVMALTYVARIKGEFEGAAPTAFHYFGLTTLLLFFIVFTSVILRKRKTSN